MQEIVTSLWRVLAKIFCEKVLSSMHLETVSCYWLISTQKPKENYKMPLSVKLISSNKLNKSPLIWFYDFYKEHLSTGFQRPEAMFTKHFYEHFLFFLLSFLFYLIIWFIIYSAEASSEKLGWIRQRSQKFRKMENPRKKLSLKHVFLKDCKFI
jgi:hypothetical protein